MRRFCRFVPIVALLAACSRGAPQLDTRTFELAHLTGAEAVQLLSPYVYADRPGGGGTLTHSGSRITVRETPDNLDKIARVLAQVDRPRPLVRLTFHLIQADGASTTDPAIGDVVPTLRKLFRYQGYRMMEEGVFSAVEGGSVEQSLGNYALGADIGHVSGGGDSAVVDLDVHLNGRDLRFRTSVAIPVGKTAVLGNVAEDPRGTLILTVHPELITTAP